MSNKIKQAKMQYYNDKFNTNLHVAKSTWKVINKILKLNSKKQNDFQIEVNGTKLCDSTEIANAFNDYFSAVAQSLAAQIPDVGIDPLKLYIRKPTFLCLLWSFNFFRSTQGGGIHFTD